MPNNKNTQSPFAINLSDIELYAKCPRSYKLSKEYDRETTSIGYAKYRVVSRVIKNIHTVYKGFLTENRYNIERECEKFWMKWKREIDPDVLNKPVTKTENKGERTLKQIK